MKVYTVITTAKAREDLESISNFIVDEYGDVYNAKKVTDRIIMRYSRLAVFPNAFAVRFVSMKKLIRAVRSGKYTIFYYVDEKDSIVYISRILYSRMNIFSILEKGQL